MKLSGIDKGSVLKAIKIIDQKQLSKSQLESEYQVIIAGKSYPFKLLVETTYKIANKEELPKDTFKEYFYLINQFESFTGFKVAINNTLLFKKDVKNKLFAIKHPSILKKTSTGSHLDIQVLGPDVNDKKIKNRSFDFEVGFEEIAAGNIVFLFGNSGFYAIVQVLKQTADTNTLIPVKVIHIFNPIIDFEWSHPRKSRYPIIQIQRSSVELTEMIESIDNYDIQLMPRIINSIVTGETIPTQPLTVNTTNMFDVNTIFYGPPGTGKTFQMQQLVHDLQLIETLQPHQKDYSQFVSSYTWWQILALALYNKKEATVPELLEHDLIKAKLAISNIQHAPQRLWSTLQHHTVLNCPNVLSPRLSHKDLIFFKELPSKWRLDVDIKVEYPYLIESFENFQKGHPEINTTKHYQFTTCHQSLSYEDFIEGIKPVLNEEKEDADQSLRYEIRKGLFYQACEKAAQRAGFDNLQAALEAGKEEREAKFQQALEQQKYHAVFLDEINRCNVAAVFGELITLIESDKRLGAAHEITDTYLPYSQTLFGVPANLLIIGSMNTADRSVEALDTALRRRFSFVEKGVDLSILPAGPEGIDLSALLAAINKRLTVLLSKDQVIGHAWLLQAKNFEQLKAAFKNKILPLLQEYFYHDYAKIGLVLGDRFVEQVREQKGLFATFKNGADLADDYEDKIIYHLNDPYTRSAADFKSIYQ